MAGQTGDVADDVASGKGRAGPKRRDPAAVPAEFRSACGRPGAEVTVRHVPVTIPHALCDLRGVRLSYPGRGGATVPLQGGVGIGNSLGFQLEVDSETLDVTVTVTGSAGSR
jgi:hypothetical protein